MQPSNTPPDGDFVRYVEQLSRTAEAAPRPADMRSALAASLASPEQAPRPTAAGLLQMAVAAVARAAEEAKKARPSQFRK